ncbi:protein kinase family protein [Nocardioides sp. LS1]|uniref:protein kinase family protein n=1 Tax=Nocardioides sp. LS1 TaxID=1027620 RepID=UPI000F61E0EF|nr:protein kinase family protein [Nocardioides sp. LS1]GCD90230.1 hypothetical protein NLS1_22360 [Nocardioides sp. LS1]
MPNSIRPGDVLADRYRLVDLLAESEGGRFWRAHDEVLQRHVALHVIDADDERAPGLLEAARQSATVPDRRLLRVLDADQVDGVTYVVNEWGSGHSLDVMLADEGPLATRRAAWLVSEVAASLAAAHAVGVAHGRLVPENVIVDRSGSVRIIGFSVDAALHGLPPGRVSTDVADLGGLLYCALTGRWPGVSRSNVPAAPQEHGRLLRPRQVRAGIPRTLDLLCDAVVNPYAVPSSRDGHDLTTAQGIRDALTDFVGDPSGMAEAEVTSRERREGSRGQETTRMPVLPPLPEMPEPEPEAEEVPGPVSAPVTDPVDESVPDDAAAITATHDQLPGSAPDAVPTPSVDLPTQAGLPIFDDATDDVSWLSARAEKAPPPPPFEPHPERPLFAPDPEDGQPVRKTRPSAATGARDYWPWDTSTGTGTGAVPVPDEDEDDEVPGRSWLRLAFGILAALVLLVAVLVAYNLGRGKTPLGAEPDDSSSSSAKGTPVASSTPITTLTASDFDPQGDPPEENPDLAPLAVDGDATTAWRTMTYDQNMGPGGLKTGVGLTIDLGESHDVSEVDLTLVGAATGVSIYVTDTAPTGVRGLTPAASVTAAARQRVPLDEPVTGRYVTVWLTSLPQIAGGYRGEIAEVGVRG